MPATIVSRKSFQLTLVDANETRRFAVESSQPSTLGTSNPLQPVKSVILQQDVVSLPHLEVIDTTGLKFSGVGPGRRCHSTCEKLPEVAVDRGNGQLEDDQVIEKVTRELQRSGELWFF